MKRYTKLKSKQCIFSKTINACCLHFVLNLFQVYEDSLLRESARYGPLSNATEIALRNLDSMIAKFLERMSLTSKVMRVESFTFCYPFNQKIVQSLCHDVIRKMSQALGLFFSVDIMVFDFLHFVFFHVQYIHYCWKHYIESTV